MLSRNGTCCTASYGLWCTHSCDFAGQRLGLTRLRRRQLSRSDDTCSVMGSRAGVAPCACVYVCVCARVCVCGANGGREHAPALVLRVGNNCLVEFKMEKVTCRSTGAPQRCHVNWLWEVRGGGDAAGGRPIGVAGPRSGATLEARK